jgi:hypothetical protein
VWFADAKRLCAGSNLREIDTAESDGCYSLIKSPPSDSFLG